MTYGLRWGAGTQVVVHGDRLVDSREHASSTIDLGRGELRAGLVNAHDHLHRNHYPRLGAPPYPDAYAWGRDIHQRHAETIARARRVDRRDALLFGALKNLIAGVTTVVHHDPWEPAFDDGFPVRVAALRTVHSLGTEPGRAAHPGGDPDGPLCIHLAEGTTAAMGDEVREAERLGLVNDRLLAVHGVGIDEAGAEILVRAGAAVVWCPTSNDYLFGRTASPELLRRADVLLGSDSLLTGAGTLLDELRFARAIGALDDRRLVDSVTERAAARLRLGRRGVEPGDPADLVFLARPLLECTCEDVHLVVVGGVPRVVDASLSELLDHLPLRMEPVRVGRRVKLVSAPLGAVAERIVAGWPEAGRIFEAGSDSAGSDGFRDLVRPTTQAGQVSRS